MLNRWIETQIKSLIRNGTDALSSSKDRIWQLEEDHSGYKYGTQPTALKKVVFTEVPQDFLTQDQHHALEAGLDLRGLELLHGKRFGRTGGTKSQPTKGSHSNQRITHALPRNPGKFCAGGKRTE